MANRAGGGGGFAEPLQPPAVDRLSLLGCGLVRNLRITASSPTALIFGAPTQSTNRWRLNMRGGKPSRAFWIGFGHAITVFGMTNFASLSVDRGFPPTDAAGAVLLSSAVTVPFLLVGGWLGDRWPVRRVMFAFAGAVWGRFPDAPLLVTAHVLLFKRAFGHRNRGRDSAQVCGCGGLFRAATSVR